MSKKEPEYNKEKSYWIYDKGVIMSEYQYNTLSLKEKAGLLELCNDLE